VREGYAVDTVSEGGAVALRLGSGEIDVVVCDIAMPGMTGLEVLKLVRQRDPDVPVVLLTGGPALETAVQAVELGALRYLMKPIELAALVNIVDDAVRLRGIAAAKRQAYELYGHAATQERNRLDDSSRFDQALASLDMAYQPIVRWSKAAVVGYEALVRHREPTLARPDELFAVAERLGRELDLGRAIRRAVAASAERAPSGTVLFVNLHPNDLADPDLCDGTAPLSRVADRVTLEITERASLDGFTDLRGRIADLRRLGFRMAVDDLGAGYAGLSTFALIHPEVVKLDMSIVRDVDRDPTKRKLVQSMADLCRELNIEVICEGIETRGERDTLIDIGCDLLQGYFFGRPHPSFSPVNPESLESHQLWLVR
jgi:EAL domain-containing protein (putative c-di-GMP-specific phosphodiesterase class I)